MQDEKAIKYANTDLKFLNGDELRILYKYALEHFEPERIEKIRVALAEALIYEIIFFLKMQIINVPRAVLNHYFNLYLGLPDLYNLGLTCKFFRQIYSLDEIEGLLHKKLTSVLKKFFGNDFNNFQEVFKKSGSVLSGSFIIQTALGENYCTDIDFYCPGHALPYFFLDKKYKLEEVSSLYNRNPHIDSTYNLVYNQKLMQISVTNVSPWETIQTTGFDICRNEFTFEYIKITNLVGILRKCTRFDISDPEDYLFRREKYESRNFRFVPFFPMKDYLEYVIFKNEGVCRVAKGDYNSHTVSFVSINKLFLGDFRIDDNNVLWIPRKYYMDSVFFNRGVLCRFRKFYGNLIKNVNTYRVYLEEFKRGSKTIRPWFSSKFKK